MADPRLNSMHLGLLPRREEYRRARAALLGERGWLTLGAEQLRGFLGDDDDPSAPAPLHPGSILPVPTFLLVDREAGFQFSLRTGLNTVGRFDDNDLVLPDLTVSRRHCVLLVHARGGTELHDTASLNGTFVNGERVRQPVRLASGDWIKITRHLLLFIRAEDLPNASGEGTHPDTALE
jgi:hypothetical protein